MRLCEANDRFVARHDAGKGCHGVSMAVWGLLCLVFWISGLVPSFAAIDNTARAVGVYNSAPVISSPSSQSIPVIAAAPQIAISKSGVLNDDDGTPGLSAGDSISYTVTVTNPGNVSLTSIVLSDPLVALTYQSGDTDLDNEIDPTESWVYTGSYILTAIDLSSNGGGDGDIDNTATVTSNEAGPVSDTIEVTINPAIAMAVAKTGTLNDDDGNPGLTAGDTVDYQITVSNIGIADLTSVAVTDLLGQGASTTALTTSFIAGDNNADNRINAGETWIYSATHVITQDNIDDGGDLENTASVTTAEIGPRDAQHVLGLVGIVESFTMTKLASLADLDADLLADAGEVINYTFRFTNTGNRTLANLQAIDPLPGLSVISCSNDLDADGDIDSLAPGQTLDCAASYTVVPADLVAGQVTNTATTSATRTNGIVPVIEDDTANDNTTTTAADTGFTLEVEKIVVSAVEVLTSVVEVQYDISIRNPNMIGMTGVAVDDDLASAVIAPATIIGTPSVISLTGFSGSGNANPGFDGDGDTALLGPNVDLAAGATGVIRVSMRVDRGSTDLDTLNVATASSDQVPGSVSSDDPGVTPANPTDQNPTPYALFDSDGDGAPDGNESSLSDRDGDGISDDQDYDPTGYFYCEDDGRLIPGGLIAVRNAGSGIVQTGVGSSGNITILEDGSGGRYQFYVTAPGTYQLIVTLPAGGIASTSRISGGTLDVSTLLPANPAVLGAGETGSTGVLSDFTSGSNPFFTEFVIEDGDPAIFNNNIPMELCGNAALTASKEVVSGPTSIGAGANNLVYRLAAENTGLIRVENTSLTDDLDAVFGVGNYSINTSVIESAPVGFAATANGGFNGSGDTNLLNAGGTLQPGERVSILLDVDVTVPAGSYTNTVVSGGENPADGSPLPVDNASATISVGGAGGGIVVTKTTSFRSAPLGARVPYIITFENTNGFAVNNVDLVDRLPRGMTYVTGSAEIDGVSVEPNLQTPELRWENRSLAAGQRVTVELMTLLGAGITGTKFTNHAYALDGATGALISNRAQATIELEIESVFQCSHVIGRVFDDLDKDGYHDPGEPGLAGVRLATVNGLLITTDQHGRYHIACESIPDARIGSNHILKLDERTLPTGYSMTSENPRVVRVTQGKLVKQNFAAANLRKVVLSIGPQSFDGSSLELKQEAIREIARIMPALEKEPSVLVLRYTGPGRQATRRLARVRELVSRAWASRKRPGRLRIMLEQPGS